MNKQPDEHEHRYRQSNRYRNMSQAINPPDQRRGDFVYLFQLFRVERFESLGHDVKLLCCSSNIDVTTKAHRYGCIEIGVALELYLRA